MTNSQQAQPSIAAGNPANGAVGMPGSVGGGAVLPATPNQSMQSILDNMMANVPDPSQVIVQPKVITQPVTPATPAAPASPAAEIKVSEDFVPEIPEDEEPIQPQAVLADSPEPDLDDLNDLGKGSAGMTNLRNAYKSAKTLQKELEQKLAAAELEREEYRTGKRLPETLKDQEAEIQRLRPLEKVHNLRGSEGYQKKLAPLKDIDGRLKQILTEYDTPAESLPQELSELRGLKSEKQINEFLEERVSPIAALEMKELLRKEQAITKEVKDLEADAERGLAQMQAETEATRLQNKKVEREKVQNWVRETFAEVTSEIKQDGRFHGLTYQTGRTEWNKTVVKPLLDRAAAESGKLLKSILEEGLTPANVKAIQKMTMLSQHAALTAAQLNESINHIQSTEQTTIRDNNIFRPAIGSGSSSVAPQKPRERMSADSAAEASLAGILGGK